MAEELFERGGVTVIRGALRCHACGWVKRGIQRATREAWVTLCDDCERDSRNAIDKREDSPLTVNPRGEGASEAIFCRNVGDWLHTLATMLEGQAAALDLLRDDSDEYGRSFNRIGEIRKTASWLADAKFEIRDPWALRVAVRDLFKLLDGAPLAVTDDGKRALAPLDADMRECLKALREAFEPFKGNL